MKRLQSGHLLVVICAVAIILVAGGLVTASNMGFKLNKELATTSGGGLNGNVWMSLPYNNPYGHYSDLCSQAALLSTGLARTGVTFINATQTAFTAKSTCGNLNATTQLLPAGVGFILNNPTGGPLSAIIVGSHNPTQAVTVLKSAPLGQLVAVPYHTTAVTASDLCVQMGLTNTGLARGQIQRFISNYPSTGVTSASFSPVFSCGNTANNFNLVLGEAVYVKEPAKASVTFIPAHF